jgi:hypothetical protein
MRQFQRLAAFLLGLGLACAPTEADHVGDYLGAIDANAGELCECEYDNPFLLLVPPNRTYDDAAACYADRGVSSAVRGCVEGLFADETTDYSPALDCRADVASATATCLNGRTCTDTARNECYDQYIDDIEDCPDLPASVESKLDDCLYN